MSARISMTRRDSSHEAGYIQIEITDEVSGIMVCSVKVPFAEFTKALTSCEVSAEFDFTPTQYTVETVGKVRITKRVHIPWDAIGKYETAKVTAGTVDKHFADNYGSEWHMQHNGTRSQQNSKEGHEYAIKKFVEVDSEEGIERLKNRY